MINLVAVHGINNTKILVFHFSSFSCWSHMVPGQCNSLHITSLSSSQHIYWNQHYTCRLCCTFYFFISKFIEFQEELWNVTTMKNEVKDGVIAGDCGVLQERWAKYNLSRSFKQTQISLRFCCIDFSSNICYIISVTLFYKLITSL